MGSGRDSAFEFNRLPESFSTKISDSTAAVHVLQIDLAPAASSACQASLRQNVKCVTYSMLIAIV